MAAVRTRILFGDDTDLLAQARAAIASRPDLDVVVAGSTAEALEAAASTPHPRVAVLPVSGELDGITVCAQLKAAIPELIVVLVVPPAEMGRRDACFIAGADDVIFGAVDAADLAGRIDARTAAPFRSAPRATVALAVHLQGSMNGPIIECTGQQISREAMSVDLPAGIQSPPANTLVRAIFTLFQGGTLTVWARFAGPTEPPPRTVLRFVGLTDTERRAIDYFVDFYLKSATARAAVEEVTGEVTRETAAQRAAAGGSAVPQTATGRTNVGPVADIVPSGETLRLLADCDLGAVAEAAVKLLSGAAGLDAQPPEGFSVLRFRTLFPKLTPTEQAALRGSSSYPDLTDNLRLSGAMKLRLFEMIAQAKTAPPDIDKGAAEQACLAAIADAQQVHKLIEAAIEGRVKAAETDAIRELGTVNVGLLNACFELKRILDQDILKKKPAPMAPVKPANGAGAEPVAPAKYERHSKEPAAAPGKEREKAKEGEKESASSPAKTSAASSEGRGRKVAMGLLLVACAAGAAWTNRYLFLPRPPVVHIESNFAYAIGKIHVMFETTAGKSRVFVVDDTWKQATSDERQKALAEMGARAAKGGYGEALVWARSGKVLASTAAVAAPDASPGAPTGPQAR